MVKRGYDKGFSSALVAAAATTDVLIPPSLAFVLYGVITETSISGLFAAGVLPGLLMGLVMIPPVYYISKKRGYGGDRWGTKTEIWKAFKEAILGLLTPVLILGGIYCGIFTPTEAAIVACFYGFIVGVGIYRNLTLKIFYEVLRDSAVSSGVVMIVVAFAGLFGWAGSTLGVMEKAAHAMLSISQDPVYVLLMINLLLLIVGSLLDGVSIFFIFTPILIPIIKYFHWDFMWFGVVMALNLSIGTITPPVALNLYVAANLADIPMERISRAIVPFFIALVVSLLITTFIPWLSLWFPKLLGLH